MRRAAHAALVAPLLAGDSAALEELAALEHRRWIADRVIDGWSYGATRDDDLKHHPLLKTGDYDLLAPAEQGKDRDQIRTVLSSVQAVDRGGAMLETRVALAGHRNLAPAEEQRAVAELVVSLSHRLSSRERVVTLVSPLAPGADLALTEGISAALAGKVGDLRLIVPEAVPYRVVLEVAAAEAHNDDEARFAFITAALKRRTMLFSRFGRVDIVRIGFAGRTDDSYRRDRVQFERALARANAYLVRRTDLLAVLWDGQPGRGLGGTGDLVDYWRNPGSIPAELDFAPAQRAAGHDPDSLVISPVTRA